MTDRTFAAWQYQSLVSARSLLMHGLRVLPCAISSNGVVVVGNQWMDALNAHSIHAANDRLEWSAYFAANVPHSIAIRTIIGSIGTVP